MSIDLWVTFWFFWWGGGGLDEEPSYLLVPELLTCLRPTSFLPTHSSLGVGGG